MSIDTVVLENQRHYGVAGWMMPAPFERKSWTDITGEPLSLTEGAVPVNDKHWTPVVTEMTDDEGWIYSTSFAHIGHPREGGRACKRATDRVRQRRWMKCETERSGNEVAQAKIAGRRRNAADARRGLQQCVEFLSEVASRRKVWEYLPWDPVAWLLVHAEHQQYLSSTESLQLHLNECVTLVREEPVEELINALEAGARISCAAYGYAIAAGHLDSIENWIALHAIHSHYFDAVAGASVDANLEAVCSFAGFQREDIVKSDWSNKEFQPCYFLALDHERQCIVLAIRGTMEVGDLVTDVSAAARNINIGGVSGKVHEGSLAAAIYIQCQTASLLAELFEQHPGWTLFITGHSLGGGVGAVLAMILKYEDALPRNAGPLQCIAVGPAAVMSENLAELCKDFVTTVIFRYDVVPRLSVYSIEALMVELANASPAKKTVDTIVQTASSAVRSLQKGFSNLKGLVAKEKSTETVGDLRMAVELAANPETVAKAIRASQFIETATNQELPDVQRCREISSPSMSAPSPRQTSGGAFSPLYPPGRVLWLLGSRIAKMGHGNNDQWWKQLHTWSKEKLSGFHGTASISDIGMTPQVMRDVSWLQEWLENNEPSPSARQSDGAEAASTQKEAKAALIETERKSFSRLLVHPLMMQDHLPKSYAESIAQLQRRFKQQKQDSM